MINHKFSLLCSRAVVDENSKSISIFDIIEQINVFAEIDQIVHLPLHCEIFSLWIRNNIDTPEQGISRVSLKDPNGISKKHVEVSIDLTKSIFFRSIIRIAGMELRGPGIYNFIIELKQNDEQWKEVSSVPFIVTYNLPKNSEKVLENE